MSRQESARTGPFLRARGAKKIGINRSTENSHAGDFVESFNHLYTISTLVVLGGRVSCFSAYPSFLSFLQHPLHTSNTMSAAALLARASGRVCLQSLRARESVATPAMFGALSRYYASKCMYRLSILPTQPLTCLQCSLPPSHRHHHARSVAHHDCW